MTLQEYLKLNDLNAIEFAEKLNVKYQTVYRWLDNTRKPNKASFKLLYKATKGKVAPNDFYQL